MGALSPVHWAIIAVVILLLFGARRLPDMARGLGQSLRIFKAETQDLRGEGGTSADAKGSSGSAAITSTPQDAASPAPTTTPSTPAATEGSTASPTKPATETTQTSS